MRESRAGKWRMRKGGLLLLMLCTLVSCRGDAGGSTAERRLAAERFMRGVYDCEPSVVQEMAADSVLISYPVFQEIFGTPAVRGRDDVEAFAKRFCSQWKDVTLTITDAVADSDRVVFMWTFGARNVESGQRSTLGGITLYRFNASGKIVAEIGEESIPGPIGRLSAGADSS